MLTLAIKADTTVDAANLTAMIAAQEKIELKKLELIEKGLDGAVTVLIEMQKSRQAESTVELAKAETERLKAETRLKETQLEHLRIEERIAAAKAEVARAMANSHA